MKSQPTSKSKIVNYLAVIFIIVILAGVALGPSSGPSRYRQSSMMQTARSIQSCLQSYADEHEGRYPEGKTSTEIFQKLIDGKYVEDASIFYVGALEISGKVPPQNNTLKSSNVCFDVTCSVDSSASDALPVVFTTGYKITYQAGAKAVPIDQSPRTWSQWWNGPDFRKTFIAVSYYNHSAMVKWADKVDGSIPNFIPADFDPKGKTYRQLRP